MNKDTKQMLKHFTPLIWGLVISNCTIPMIIFAPNWWVIAILVFCIYVIGACVSWLIHSEIYKI